jgi:catechol 2,3-dioxygenase-like lactoylglutathione lyase family enzyme
MASSFDHVSAISLFVEDLQAAKDFYSSVFRVPVVFEDATSVALRLENLIVNLLQTDSANELVEPLAVGSRESGPRFQLSIWVPDVDAVCVELQRRGVNLLTGPRDRPWGMRTASFVDPAGHSWEIGQSTTGG